MHWNIFKKVNAKDKYMCYFYKEGQIFELILFHNFMARNAGDVENKSVEHLWSNEKPLVFLNAFFQWVFLKNRAGEI